MVQLLGIETTLPGDDALLMAALRALREVLPEQWRLERETEPDVPQWTGLGFRPDVVLQVADERGSSGRVLLEARSRFTARDAQRLVAVQLPRLSSIDPRAGVVVVAPWLSRRAQAVLTEAGVGYLDLTGNAWLRQARPALYVRTQGDRRDPNPVTRGGATMRGPRAGRLVRALVDVTPPHSVTDLAAVAGVSIGYASRLLTAMDGETLIQRGPRGSVISVDWPALLQRRAEDYSVLGTNTAVGFVASTGARTLFARLSELGGHYRAVTGSFAAAQIVTVAAPAQLMLYVEDIDVSAAGLDLIAADAGGDVILLRPHDPDLLARVVTRDDVRTVPVSQLTVDCLTGNGRMPAEGEALLEWMTTHEDRWRLPIPDRTAGRSL